MRIEVKTKFTTITFNEDYEGGTPIFWATVDLANDVFKTTRSNDPRANVFTVLMDLRLQSEARQHLAEAVTDPVKDIHLEEFDLIVTFKLEFKHHAAKLLGIVESVEAQFLSLIESGKSVVT